ncbi:MAG: hypothetical protein ABI556_16430 [Gemmatimonadales bacterium]
MHVRMQKSTIALAAFAAVACAEPVTSTAPTPPSQVSASAVKFWDVGSSVKWNRRAVALFKARGGPTGRIMAYLSLAQYRAVLAAQDGKQGSMHPSPAAAAAGASAALLVRFYPLDSATLEAELDAQSAQTPWPGEKNKDWDAGEAIGRSIGAATLAFAATDNVGATNPGTPPVGPGYWSSATPTVRGNFGARPFFISANEVILPPPPAFGSPAYLTALAEVRNASDNRTPAQLAISQKWAPFGGIVYNLVIGDLIEKHHVSEVDAARTYAYANTAAFDAIVACFENKFRYWFIRPSKADVAITTPIGLPNHPSYPSAHSCESGAFNIVLSDAFPTEITMLAGLEQEAADSRLLAGLHYRFDNEAGNSLGHTVGLLALARRGLE